MKKRMLIIFSIACIILFIYLNRSYAHIYQTIENAHLTSSDQTHIYKIGNTFAKSLTYVAIGDSLTSGVGVDSYTDSYPYQFAQKISQKGTQVILKTEAVPGARSIDVVNNFLDSSIEAKPDIVTLLVGVNDIHGNISAKEFKNNYETILKKLTQETKADIYSIAIPYIGAPQLIQFPYNYYFNFRTREFNTIIQDLDETYHVKYVDLYTQNRNSPIHDAYYASDLFHPSQVGYTLWADILYASFNQ
jgi:lysophospholipase L1-like esterase